MPKPVAAPDLVGAMPSPVSAAEPVGAMPEPMSAAEPLSFGLVDPVFVAHIFPLAIEGDGVNLHLAAVDRGH